ncbi:MAG: hypothetical protein KDG54_07425 [Geminicoccaceae bacterium]|nr:hypothetical protein [Geminicoccaceae bacterium]
MADRSYNNQPTLAGTATSLARRVPASTLLCHLIDQDMRVGKGVMLLDPHGDLFEDVLARVPGSRLEDLVLLDLADSDYAVGINSSNCPMKTAISP